MRNPFFSFVMLLICGLAFVAPLHAACTIDDEEEYAVFAAVLFPNEPDVPDRMTNDPERKAYLASVTVRLSGFHGSSYRVQDETTEAKVTGASDQFMDKDFNRKNAQTCRIDEAKLLAHMPGKKQVSLVSADELRKAFSAQLRGGEGRGNSRETLRSGGGVVFFSRPGFNGNRTESMVDASFRADPEMGVGYRVYLQKSPKTHKWIITDATMIRMY